MIKEFIYDCAAIFHQLGVAALKDCDPAKKAMGPSHAHSLEQGIFVLLDRRLGKRRLLALEESMEQELDWVRAFYVIRMQAEGLMEKE